MTPTFLQEVPKRSQTAPLKIFVDHTLPIELTRMFWDGLITVAKRVKTLYMDQNHRAHGFSFSKITSFFPFLETILYDFSSPIDPDFETACTQLPVKALQATILRSGILTMPERFSELRWLRLMVDSPLPPLLLFRVLGNLPNLQVLYLCLPADPGDSTSPTLTNPRITFQELKVLIAESPIIQFIDAPKLTYLRVQDYPASDDNAHLGGFNFSGITHINFEIGGVTDYRFEGSNDAGVCFSSDHWDVTLTYSIFDPVPTFYPNAFLILCRNPSEDSSTDGSYTFPLFATCLPKLSNLKEISLGCSESSNPPWCPWQHDEMNSILTHLRGATTIHKLIVTSGCSFATLCDFLSDGTLFPHLEKITYSVCEDEKYSSQNLIDLHHLQNMMKGRSGVGPIARPLQIELQYFPLIRSELLGQIDNLGIQLTLLYESDDKVSETDR